MLALLVIRIPSPFGSRLYNENAVNFVSSNLKLCVTKINKYSLSSKKNNVGCHLGMRVNTVLLHLLQASGPPLPPLDQGHHHVPTSHSLL